MKKVSPGEAEFLIKCYCLNFISDIPTGKQHTIQLITNNIYTDTSSKKTLGQ